MKQYDVLILGSSFSGSILGWILAAQGMRVFMLDRHTHPRFSIGESSTPVADIVIADLAKRYALPQLASLSMYGRWKQELPHLVCGKKRGFSYFKHRKGECYGHSCGKDSLLVAASACDAESDTHWLRSDVDTYLFRQSCDAGVHAIENCHVNQIVRENNGWRVSWRHTGTDQYQNDCARIIIDATGHGGLMGDKLGLSRLDKTLSTTTSALYGHFRGVESWDARQLANGDSSTIDPFRSDDAAQHHLIDDGWVWLLRFDDGRTSIGLVENRQVNINHDLEGYWKNRLQCYPSLWSLFENCQAIPQLYQTGSLQRLWSESSGPGWAMLPTTSGFIDPLHSTGIAHSIHGVARLASLLLHDEHSTPAWDQYGQNVIDEIRFIDQLVSAAYAAINHFELFSAASSLYFLATIQFEKKLLSDAACEDTRFLAADNITLRERLTESCTLIHASVQGHISESYCLSQLRHSLSDFDRLGFFQLSTKNRFAHTAPRKLFSATS
tara:strand:- start:615 stop:2105 length:1491 start_codon:yes stop_codon:yes gene_type:complete